MKYGFNKMACGLAAALAISLAACDDSSSGPSSNGCEALSPECGYTEKQLCDMGETQYCNSNSETTGDSADEKSSDSNEKSATSQNGTSSAEVDESSSSFNMPTCSHYTDSDCRISEGCSPTPCEPGTRFVDCATNRDYVCNGGVWTVVIESSSSVTPSSSSSSTEGKCFDFENMCPVCNDGALCPVSNRACDACNVEGEIAFDCTTKEQYVCTEYRWQKKEASCTNISGVEGYDRWNCNEEDFTLTTDCNDNSITYMCVSNHWFKTDDCDPTKPNCGFDNYTICEKTMLKAYCLKTEWLDKPCDYGNDPGRFLYVYHNPDDPNDLGHTQVRYFCNASGNWEEENYGCSDPMKDCGNKIDKSDDQGILPDNAPCDEEGTKMVVKGYTFQCISKIWTRL